MTTIDPTVYRFYDQADRLLYVGKTISPRQRLKKHRQEKDWFTDVAAIKLERHATEADALDAERQAILAESPVHNIQHNTNTMALPVTAQPAGDNADPLVGMFYLTWLRCEHCGRKRGPDTQGEVVGRNDYGYLLSEFSWMTGSVLQIIVKGGDFPYEATFYADQEWFIHGAEEAWGRRAIKCCEAVQ